MGSLNGAIGPSPPGVGLITPAKEARIASGESADGAKVIKAVANAAARPIDQMGNRAGMRRGAVFDPIVSVDPFDSIRPFVPFIPEDSMTLC
jgi:hypothetical protein